MLQSRHTALVGLGNARLASGDSATMICAASRLGNCSTLRLFASEASKPLLFKYSTVPGSIGRDRVYAGSLLKVYGHVTTDYDDRGGPIVKTEYYRHWPRNTYVSSSHAVNMRR